MDTTENEQQQQYAVQQDNTKTRITLEPMEVEEQNLITNNSFFSHTECDRELGATWSESKVTTDGKFQEINLLHHTTDKLPTHTVKHRGRKSGNRIKLTQSKTLESYLGLCSRDKNVKNGKKEN